MWALEFISGTAAPKADDDMADVRRDVVLVAGGAALTALACSCSAATTAASAAAPGELREASSSPATPAANLDLEPEPPESPLPAPRADAAAIRRKLAAAAEGKNFVVEWILPSGELHVGQGFHLRL